MSPNSQQMNWDVSDDKLAALLDTDNQGGSHERTQAGCSGDLNFRDIDPGNLFMVLGRT